MLSREAFFCLFCIIHALFLSFLSFSCFIFVFIVFFMLCFWTAALKEPMTYGNTQGKFQSLFLYFYISTFLRPPKLEPPDHLAAPPDALASPQTLQLASWPSNWPPRPSDCPLDHPSGLPDPPAVLLTLQFTSHTLQLPSWPSVWPPRPSSTQSFWLASQTQISSVVTIGHWPL